jgi:hypothetical protein
VKKRMHGYMILLHTSIVIDAIHPMTQDDNIPYCNMHNHENLKTLLPTPPFDD